MQQSDYRAAIQRLLAIMRETAPSGGSVALMCSEGDPRQCHRHHLIARSLLDPDETLRAVETPLTVQHILRDGTLESPVSPAEFDIPRQQKLFE